MAASGAYASALGNLRDTVKWIIAAFTSAAAIIFSGLAVTNISKLAESGQWLLPVVLAAVPLLATVGVVLAALQVINVTPPSVGNLFPSYWESLGAPAAKSAQRPAALADELPNAIAVYGTAKEFDDRLVNALAHTRRMKNLLDGSSERQAAYEAALALLDGLQSTVKDALDCAAYVRARQRYRTAMWQILGAVTVAVAGLVASGVVSGNLIRTQQADNASSAKTASPAPASFRGPTSVSVWFPSKPPATAGGPHTCPLWNGIPAMAVGGTFSRPLLLFPGYTTADARRNGIVRPPGQCNVPWLWSTKSGQVLVVPR